MTLLLPDGTLVVSFRGTDTLVRRLEGGLQHGFQYPVPASSLRPTM